MRNRRYFPYERNSFYPGKLLTARDFEAEQRYMNDKRRLLNRLLCGNGIVSGLGVIMADDSSLILQAGCALDASGREIVVPETRVIKLPTVEGYERLATNCAYLGIRYEEAPAEEVYSVMSEENGAPRFNKVAESYRLILADESMTARVPREMDEFVNRVVVYAAEDVEVSMRVPAYLPRNSDLRVRFTIARLLPGSGEYAFTCQLRAPGFHYEDGDGPVEVAADQVKLLHGETQTFEYVLESQPYLWGGDAAVLSVEGFLISKGEEEFSLNRKLETSVKPVDQPMDEFYRSVCYGRPMDKQLMETFDENLWIAKLLLIRRGSSILVDRVLPPPFGQYSYNAQQLMTLRELEDYYPAPGAKTTAPAGTPAEPQTVTVADSAGLKGTACGVFSLSLGLGADQKGPAFSEEIMHGLGKGPVYVDVGVEYIDSAAGQGGSGEILLGNVSLFKSDAPAGGEERVYNLTTAVKVLPERGTFVVAVGLEKPTGLISLRVRWFAFRLGELSQRLKPQDQGERMLLLNPDTIVLAPKTTAHLSPIFVNMPSEACAFRVMDPEGGTVDQNGLYTAPAKEGAYEVRVEAISNPKVFTHAFMIVSQKKKEG